MSAPRGGRAAHPEHTHPEEPRTAAALVATLWRAAWPGRAPLEAEPITAAVDLPTAIRRVAGDAETLAVTASAAEQRAAHLLAETARAVYDTLAGRLSSPDGVVSGGGALASSARRRIARMEQWLAARTATDPDAEPSADLCLWVLDHLEGDVG
ncbi:MAG TPA: hypothetical protein VGD56_13160 [Gemmatirosa sp.]